MKGWVGLVSWPTADDLPKMVTHQLQFRHRPGEVHQSETGVLPLSYAAKYSVEVGPCSVSLSQYSASFLRSSLVNVLSSSIPEHKHCWLWFPRTLQSCPPHSGWQSDTSPWLSHPVSMMTSCNRSVGCCWCWWWRWWWNCCWYADEVVLLLALIHDIASRRCLRHFARRFLNQTCTKYHHHILIELESTHRVRTHAVLLLTLTLTLTFDLSTQNYVRLLVGYPR